MSNVIANLEEWNKYIRKLYDSGEPPYMEDGSINPLYLRFNFEFNLKSKEGENIIAKVTR